MNARSLAGVLLATSLAVTACGGSPDTTAEAGTAAPSPTATDNASVVSHDMGETEVPADPARVVVLDTPHLDTALSLGVTPVGAVSVFGDGELPAYLGERTEGIEVVGSIAEPDLEAIAQLDPDLILSATVRHEGIYDQLSQIAPTVFTESSGTDWKQGFELVARSLGLEEQGREALDEYEQRVTTIGDELGVDGATAAIVRFLPDQTRIYGPDTFSGSVLTEVGFDLPDLEYDEYSMAYISPEQFEQADADVIYTSVYGDPAETTRADVTGLWGNLDAVASGCQFEVADDEWMIGIGLIGANIVLDDLESTLEGSGCLEG